MDGQGSESEGRRVEAPPGGQPSLRSSVARGALAVGITASIVLALSRPADEPLDPGAEIVGVPTAAPTAPATAPATETPAAAAPPAEPGAPASTEPLDEPREGRPRESSPEPAEDPAAGILAAAPDPSTTTVQILDGIGDRRRAAAAAARLGDLGYRVVARNPAGLDYAESVVQVTAGHEAAGRALQLREPRVGPLDSNRNLSRDVDLHLIVGADWPR